MDAATAPAAKNLSKKAEKYDGSANPGARGILRAAFPSAT